MTLHLQPCDAGIIATVKSHYRKCLVRHVLAKMDRPNTATELSKWVDVLDAIGWLWLAVVGCGWLWLAVVGCGWLRLAAVDCGWGWCSVSTSTIVKCFAQCGFVRGWSQWQMKVMDWSTLMVTYRLLGRVSWDDYITRDDRTLTTDTAGDDWEAVIGEGNWRRMTMMWMTVEKTNTRLPVITSRNALIQIKNILGCICSGCQQCISAAELAAGTLHQAGCPCRSDNHH